VVKECLGTEGLAEYFDLYGQKKLSYSVQVDLDLDGKKMLS
jgi:hypothetical protein